MSRDIIEDTPDIWGSRSSTDSSKVERDYDTFARTGTYDETFDEWGYVGPQTAAAIMRMPVRVRTNASCWIWRRSTMHSWATSPFAPV